MRARGRFEYVTWTPIGAINGATTYMMQVVLSGVTAEHRDEFRRLSPNDEVTVCDVAGAMESPQPSWLQLVETQAALADARRELTAVKAQLKSERRAFRGRIAELKAPLGQIEKPIFRVLDRNGALPQVGDEVIFESRVGYKACICSDQSGWYSWEYEWSMLEPRNAAARALISSAPPSYASVFDEASKPLTREMLDDAMRSLWERAPATSVPPKKPEPSRFAGLDIDDPPDGGTK